MDRHDLIWNPWHGCHKPSEGWDNVTFAVSCENQNRLDERMPHLLAVPAKHRWISLKPFIGKLNIDGYLKDGIAKKSQPHGSGSRSTSYRS